MKVIVLGRPALFEAVTGCLAKCDESIDLTLYEEPSYLTLPLDTRPTAPMSDNGVRELQRAMWRKGKRGRNKRR